MDTMSCFVLRSYLWCVCVYIYIYIYDFLQAATQQQVTSKVGHHGHLGVIARLLLALVLKQDTEIAFLPMIVLLEEMKQSHV